MRLGFLINPIAGMGGRVGLKGTDGVIKEAIDLGAKPIAYERAEDALKRYIDLVRNLDRTYPFFKKEIIWYTCSGSMGFDVLKTAGIGEVNNKIIIKYEPEKPGETTANDTKVACIKLLEAKVDLIIFCGGDGTARDIYSVVTDKVPILGIPSGVKMHSGVFATHASSVGDILIDYISGEMDIADGEILDLDEDLYRGGEWNIRLFGTAKTPHDPSLIQRGKHMVESASENEIKEEIADYIKEEMENNPDIMYILGSGSTVHAVAELLGINGTLLGIDAVYNWELIGKDLNEQRLLELIKTHPKARLVVSPIGAQGFILGRGNLQLSPKLIKKIGIDNIDILSTPVKLAELELLRVDTNDPELDSEFVKKGWIKVIYGYRQMRLKKMGK